MRIKMTKRTRRPSELDRVIALAGANSPEQLDALKAKQRKKNIQNLVFSGVLSSLMLALVLQLAVNMRQMTRALLCLLILINCLAMVRHWFKGARAVRILELAGRYKARLLENGAEAGRPPAA